MPVRFVTKAEMLTFDKISSVAFVQSMDVAEREETLNSQDAPEKGLIAYINDAGEMTAGMWLPEFDMWFDGGLVKMMGIGGVVSLPEHRHERAIRQCFDFAFREAYKKGAVFSSLYPFSHPFYRKFGYEFTEPTYTYELQTEDLAKKYKHNGWAKMYEKSASLDDYKRIHESHFQKYNTAIRRCDKLWSDSRLSKDPYKEKVYTYLLGDEGGANAYLTIVAEKAGDYDNTANVVEIAYLTPDAFIGALGFLSRFAAAYSKVKLRLPPGVPVAHLIDEPYDVQLNVLNHVMFRVVNVESALLSMRYPDGTAFSIAVQDDGISENNGTFRVLSSGGRTTVQRTSDASCDLSLDVRALAPLILGALTIDEAAYRTDAQVHKCTEALRNVFVKRPCFLTQHF